MLLSPMSWLVGIKIRSRTKQLRCLFLQQAHLSYTEWNAFEKAQRLVNEFPELESEMESSFNPDGLQGQRLWNQPQWHQHETNFGTTYHCHP
jgi:hypothetical protein